MAERAERETREMNYCPFTCIQRVGRKLVLFLAKRSEAHGQMRYTRHFLVGGRERSPWRRGEEAVGWREVTRDEDKRASQDLRVWVDIAR